MTLTTAIATFVGAAIFPFVIRILWGHFVDEFGTFGGFLAALFIVGVIWALNHGYTNASGGGLIFQGGAWIDMGFAAGVGCLVASVLRGAKVDQATKTNLLAALCGGVLGGLILTFANMI